MVGQPITDLTSGSSFDFDPELDKRDVKICPGLSCTPGFDVMQSLWPEISKM